MAAIFALINTTTVGGEYACALGVPCEVTKSGTQMRPNSSYATPVTGVVVPGASQQRWPRSGETQQLMTGHGV